MLVCGWLFIKCMLELADINKGENDFKDTKKIPQMIGVDYGLSYIVTDTSLGGSEILYKDATKLLKAVSM